MSNLKPLPCPFCKSKNVVSMFIDWRHGIRCNDCQGAGPRIYDEDEAIFAWNMYSVHAKPQKIKLDPQ